MSDTPPRPWHDAENPYEALFQHFEAKIAALETRVAAEAAKHVTVTVEQNGTETPAA